MTRPDQTMTTPQPHSDDIEISLHDWTSARERAMPLRIAVFVEEQNVALELEQDTLDPVCQHALACLADGTTIATGRLLPDGHIGRLAVATSHRGRGVGSLVLQALIEAARSQGFSEVVLNAQLHALSFYERHQFIVESNIFDVDGIPHRSMRRYL